MKATNVATVDSMRRMGLGGMMGRREIWHVIARRWPCLMVMLAGTIAGCAMPQPETAGPTQTTAAAAKPGTPVTAANRAAMTTQSQATSAAADKAAATTQPEAVLLLQRAEAALAAGDSQSALDSFSQVLQGEPHNQQALMGMGESYLLARNPKSALEVFEQAEREAPELQARALQGQGLALSTMGQRDEGQKRLLEALKLDPGLWRAWNAAGVNYDQMGAWTDARASYEKAVAADPAAAAAVRNNEGMSLLLQRKDQEAEAAFQEALELDPRSMAIRANLRIALASQGKYDDALAAVPSSQLATALNNVGYIAMTRGDYIAAQKYLAQAMQASPAYYEKAAKNLAYVEYLMSKSGPKQSAGAGRTE